jgi:hypothetical protein
MMDKSDKVFYITQNSFISNRIAEGDVVSSDNVDIEERFDRLLGDDEIELIYTFFHYSPRQRNSEAFYLTPLKIPNTGCWYSTVPLGDNKLQVQLSDFVTLEELLVLNQTTAYRLQLQQGYTTQRLTNNLYVKKQVG